jgi:K+-transporting ATPase ATPase A chain
MVGRTPEYLGKKIEAREIKLTMLALLTVPVGMLVIPAVAVVIPSAAAAILNPGPHGLAEMLYAYASATGNNGSAFAGFNGASTFHLTAQGLAMLAGRFAFIIPILAIGGSLGAKKIIPPSAGTFPTHTPLFVCLLMAVILVLGGLTFFPALAVSSLAEHFEMMNGRAF